MKTLRDHNLIKNSEIDNINNKLNTLKISFLLELTFFRLK